MGEDVVMALESRGEIPPKVISSWRAAGGEAFRSPDTHEIVVFDSFFSHGFGLPTHPFLRRVLHHYDISLCNLNPNSILHLTMLSKCVKYSWELIHTSFFSATSSTCNLLGAR
ncbi:hypothetical protein GUJ93_ZPchr0013g34567 [Zizania palustris]|uniref:Transposase (putative) gypsy type domain-containing protein n=1 Tax=Zizania palustris TaxID=103762 RepID=A0A8J5X4P8_ZIZPA|nr:hypothetical protein GUJ93_ZPchr0013g34567 [Zizania palustris]